MLEKARVTQENLRLYGRIDSVQSKLSKEIIMQGLEKLKIVKPINPEKIVRKV